MNITDAVTIEEEPNLSIRVQPNQIPITGGSVLPPKSQTRQQTQLPARMGVRVYGIWVARRNDVLFYYVHSVPIRSGGRGGGAEATPRGRFGTGGFNAWNIRLGLFVFGRGKWPKFVKHGLVIR